MLLHNIFILFLGLAWGFAVGSGFVAFITVLDIIPRLIQLTKTASKIHSYEYAVICGVLAFTWFDLRDWNLTVPSLFMVLVGLLMGIFIGMLAAALTEVLNVIPILAKRLHMQNYLLYLLMAMAFGKIVGSLFQWLWFYVW
ncbi:stage V sporulation protein AB [Thermoflavimicrobium daqui]|uniref:Stage V sporulation protein AB n=1 Tax=Thermoflavimicrobium daqui TaxID=2137476 RepID=A0A364K879_9BACL|nr:stage V sporulation protein AB [Thermoflavimicrobium daqui]RAL26505.1 stage V sporulation protein AB [Thermoflavimicrobium daqui]